MYIQMGTPGTQPVYIQFRLEIINKFYNILYIIDGWLLDKNKLF